MIHRQTQGFRMQDNDERIGTPPLRLLVGALLALSIAAVTTITLLDPFSAPSVPTLTPEETPPLGEPLATIYFNPGASELANDSRGAIQKIWEATQLEPDSIVLISGFHDPSGDPARNAELARERALSAKAALLMAGVPEHRIVLRRPEEVPGADMQEARRVDLRVQPRLHP